jgi:hypothetical protein
MDKTQKVLVRLLSAAIRGRHVEELECDDINWPKVNEKALIPSTFIFHIRAAVQLNCTVRLLLMGE